MGKGRSWHRFSPKEAICCLINYNHPFLIQNYHPKTQSIPIGDNLKKQRRIKKVLETSKSLEYFHEPGQNKSFFTNGAIIFPYEGEWEKVLLPNCNKVKEFKLNEHSATWKESLEKQREDSFGKEDIESNFVCEKHFSSNVR